VPAVWYLMRASGVVAPLLLMIAFAPGVTTSNRWRPTGSRLFVTTTLHRNASLLAVAFLAVHVLTAVVDVDAQVGVASVIFPVGPGWLAVGTLALELVAALVLTSLVRRRLSHRVWRAIHWSAYGAWPLGIARARDGERHRHVVARRDDDRMHRDHGRCRGLAPHRTVGCARCARLRRRLGRARTLGAGRGPLTGERLQWPFCPLSSVGRAPPW
jgi:hypothetical protein